MQIKFFVAGIPQTAGSKKAFRHRYTKKIIVKDDNEKGPGWRKTVQWQAKIAMTGLPLLEGPLEVTFMFYLPRPKGHFGKHGVIKKSSPKYPIVKPDVLKLSRAAEDALTGFCWNDDAQIVIEHLYKYYDAVENANCGCDITIKPLES
jgi:Holliday junction resolvase RusA-like endonuclease